MLVVTQQPTDTVAGQTMANIIVKIEDPYGNVAMSDDSNVTLVAGDGTPVGGTTSVSAVNGVATFTNLSMTLAGSYTLSVTDGSLSPATSHSFNITSAAPAKLVVSGQPTIAGTGQSSTPVVVKVEDSFGNVVVNDQSNVTLSNPALSGTTTVAAIDGVATFSDLTIAGTGSVTLSATDGALAPAATTPVDVIPVAVVGTQFQPMAISPATVFPTTGVSSKSITIKVVSDSDDAVMLSRTFHPLKGKAFTVRNLNIKEAGIYDVNAVDAYGNVVTLEQIQVVASAARKIAFTVQPTIGAGQPFSASVSVYDRYGNLTVADDGSTMTLGVWQPTRNGPVLEGNITATITQGVATFTNLSLSHPGKVRLVARVAHLTPVVSNAILE
jgi:hypothetical protein